MFESLPEALHALLAGAERRVETIGMSGASVERVTWPDGRQGYLKTVQRSNSWHDEEVSHETDVLRWLAGRLFAPAIIYAGADDQRRYLLTEALRGTMSHELTHVAPHVALALGEGLRQIHAIPITDCPFPQTLDVKLMVARRHIAEGMIDMDDFEDDTRGMPEDLWTYLDKYRPLPEDFVFTHGDYCLPNILLDPGTLRIAGFVDWGRASIADRYHDLGIAARSIRQNLGQEYIAPFFAAYGIRHPDQRKIDYYIRLDELF